MRLYAPAHGSTFWNLDSLAISAKDSREFQHLMHAWLRAAPNWAAVDRLWTDNAAIIARLDRATREDVLAALAAREKELEANG